KVRRPAAAGCSTTTTTTTASGGQVSTWAGLRYLQLDGSTRLQQLAQFVLVGVIQALLALLGQQFFQPLQQQLFFQLGDRVVQLFGPFAFIPRQRLRGQGMQ